MLHAAPLGRALPAPPSLFDATTAAGAADTDLACATAFATPRPPETVSRLAQRILPGTILTKYSIVWAAVSFGLWLIGTAVALVITKLEPSWGSTPILALGFGGLGGGIAIGCLWIRKRRSEAQMLAREGQLVVGRATYRRRADTFGDELRDMLASPLGETRYCVVFKVGFIQHQMWVALSEPHVEGERMHVLVQPGARLGLAFDSTGRGYVGEPHRS
jgi:hypothetical protein